MAHLFGSYGKATLLASVAVGAHALVVAVLVALLLAVVVGVAFHIFAPQYAAPAGFLVFVIVLALLLL